MGTATFQLRDDTMKRIFILMGTLAFYLMLTGLCLAKLSPEERQTLYKAQLLMHEKKFTEAETVIKNFMNSTQEVVNAKTYLMLGDTLYQSGKKKQALKVFSVGHATFPNNEFLCLNTGVALYQLGYYAEAGSHFEKTYSLQNPAKPELLFQAGSAYYQGEKFHESARVLKYLLAKNQNPQREWIRLTIHALIESKQSKQAESMLLRYLNQNPQEADYWKLLAKLNMDREKFFEAGAALEICYKLVTPSKSELESLASLYSYQEAPLLAATTLQRAYGDSPEPAQSIKIAALLASAGRIKQAIDYLDKHAGTSSVTMEKGKLLFRDRRFNEAGTVFRQILKIKDEPEARFFLALCAWEQKDWKQAKEELKTIAALKVFKAKASRYLVVLNDLESARIEINK